MRSILKIKNAAHGVIDMMTINVNSLYSMGDYNMEEFVVLPDKAGESDSIFQVNKMIKPRIVCLNSYSVEVFESSKLKGIAYCSTEEGSKSQLSDKFRNRQFWA